MYRQILDVGMLQEGNIAIITRIVTIINTHSLPFFRVLQKNELIVDFFSRFFTAKRKILLKDNGNKTKQNKIISNFYSRTEGNAVKYLVRTNFGWFVLVCVVCTELIVRKVTFNISVVFVARQHTVKSTHRKATLSGVVPIDVAAWVAALYLEGLKWISFKVK